MKLAITDSRISEACELGLVGRGFRVIKLPPSKRLPSPMASHPDMLMFSAEGSIITSADYCDEADYIFSDISCFSSNIKISFTEAFVRAEYPYDCIFNALVIGRRIFCKTDTVSPKILQFAREKGYKVIHVNQGYPACVTLALSDKYAITADRGMAEALSAEGISVTLIENGDISLPPYEYGFIGGACGVFGNTVYFLGDPKRHRSYNAIISTIKNAGMSYIALSREALCDLGRIIFIE